MEAEIRRLKRSDPQVREKEAEWKRVRRANPIINQREAERNTKRMQKKWASEIYREIEMVQKWIKCQDSQYKSKETIQNTLQKQRACQDPYKVLNEKQQAENRKFESNMTELLKIFNENIAEGPVYVCTCCQQIWFKHSVLNIDEIILKTDNERTTFSTCRTQYQKMEKSGFVKLSEIQLKKEKFPSYQ